MFMILNIFLRTEESSLSCFSLCCIFFSPIFFAVTLSYACLFCLSLSPISFSFLLFCHWHVSILLAFGGTFGLSELHGILGVGSGSTSSCTTSQKVLLWVLPGMFFAWKYFADVPESCLWCSLNYPHVWVHTDLECLTSPCDVTSQPLHLAVHFLLCLVPFCGGVC